MSRALASLGRFPEAHDAFNHAMALAPRIAGHRRLAAVMPMSLSRGAIAMLPSVARNQPRVPGDPSITLSGAAAARQSRSQAPLSPSSFQIRVAAGWFAGDRRQVCAWASPQCRFPVPGYA
jgi:hypothetical protein